MRHSLFRSILHSAGDVVTVAPRECKTSQTVCRVVEELGQWNDRLMITKDFRVLGDDVKKGAHKRARVKKYVYKRARKRNG